MEENLIELKLPPGLATNGTPYSNRGRWGSGNLIRFFEGTIRPIGTWRRKTDGTGASFAAIAGVARAALSWRDDSGNPIIGIGTTQKLMLLAGGITFDATPSGFVSGVVNSGAIGGSGTYGHGAYGAGPYGSGTSDAGFVAATTWQLDVFGSYLVAVDTKNQALYIWQGSSLAVAAVASGSPDCNAVVVTAERFLVALGADGDVRKVKWASQETFDAWTPSDSNTAGDFPLTTNGALMCGRRIRGGTLLWTDLDLWLMTYLGDTELIFSFHQVGDHCGIIAPNAVTVVDGRAMWMGQDSFYGYDGGVLPIPCDVSDSVFGDLNYDQRAKIFAVPLSEFGEVVFYYPSSMATEIDSYVVYNYKEQHWALGKLVRTAGATDGPTDYPILLGTSTGGALVYEHELPIAAGTAGAGHDGVVPFVESGPVELDAGDNVMKLNRLVPDEKTLGDVSATIYTSFYPTDTEVANGPYTMAAPTNIRLTARQVRIRFNEARATAWRIGTMRLGVRKGGRR